LPTTTTAIYHRSLATRPAHDELVASSTDILSREDYWYVSAVSGRGHCGSTRFSNARREHCLSFVIRWSMLREADLPQNRFNTNIECPLLHLVRHSLSCSFLPPLIVSSLSTF